MAKPTENGYGFIFNLEKYVLLNSLSSNHMSQGMVKSIK